MVLLAERSGMVYSNGVLMYGKLREINDSSGGRQTGIVYMKIS
jgi:hypothetical protein